MEMRKYILSIDQSTACTKALLFDRNGNLFERYDIPHRQLVDDNGWVEHNPEEIYTNLIKAVQQVIRKADISSDEILSVAISNQRETSIAWDRNTGKAACNAIVWQCGRGEAICNRIKDKKTLIKERTGLILSPYFSAAKFAWILENVPKAKELADEKKLICSTMDSWLIYKLTVEHVIKTEYSNASRTQLFNINTLEWDEEICKLFGLSEDMLPAVCDSDSLFGHTDFDGILDNPVPLHGVMGDSQSALFAQGCLEPGMVKATYGTGSSIMMNIGKKPIQNKTLVTSIAWSMGGTVQYVMEGNINYSGATIKWLVDDLKLISSPKESGPLAETAKASPGLYLVPSFSGLGAPYWKSEARALVCGMSRTTGKAEFIRAAEESIAYQITDIVLLMNRETGYSVKTLRVDGGATNDMFLMQFQADIMQSDVRVASLEELSGQGVAFAAGIALGFYKKETVFNRRPKKEYQATMSIKEREEKYHGWLKAVKLALAYI